MKSSSYITCSVLDCKTRRSQEPQISFFLVPSDPSIRVTWLAKIHREDRSSRMFVCEKHFEKCYINFKSESSRKRLLRNAIPTLCLPNSDTDALYLNMPVASTSTHESSTDKQQLSQRNHQNSKLLEINEESDGYSVFIDDDDYGDEEPLVLTTVEFVPKVEGVISKPKKQKYSCEFKMFALNMYFSSPNSYRALQKSFRLPRLSSLYRMCIPTTTELNHNILAALKMKADSMTQAQKQCVVCLGSIAIATNIYYDIEADKLIGFHEVDGVQILEPANTALLIMVRGLFHNWKQTISFSLLSKLQNYQDVNRLITDIISRLFKIGLKVRVIMTDLETEKLTGGLGQHITPWNAFITVDDNNIYYMYDILHLMKNIRSHFMTHDFGSAKWQHIKDCYNNDINRQLLRIAPKLSLKDIILDSNKRDDLQKNRDLFSKETSTAIAMYVDMKVLDSSAMHTAQLILNLNNITEMLNFNSTDLKEDKNKVFTGQTAQVEFLISMFSLFENLRFSPLFPHHKQEGLRENGAPAFVEAIRVTINSIMLLYGNLISEKCWHPVVGLTRDCLDDFFKKVCEMYEASRPTAKGLIDCISNFPIFNIFPYFCQKIRSNDLEIFMSLATQMTGISKYEKESVGLSLDVSVQDTEEFSKVKFENKKLLEQMAMYLLYKGYQRHKGCEDMETYVCGGDPTNYNFLLVMDSDITIKYNTDKLPPSFHGFVVQLEMKFKQYFKENRLTRSLAGLDSFIKNITFDMPCPCFPLDYVKKLYLRFRLYIVLEYNNKFFQYSHRPFVVNN